VAAIISVFGMVRLALSVREKWKKRERRSFGHEQNPYFPLKSLKKELGVTP
jgi:hypothetical protein